METMNITAVRAGLNRILDGWRAGVGAPIYIGPYGADAEAILLPAAVWQRVLTALAECWDLQTAPARVSRLDDQAGPQPIGLAELARVAGSPGVPVPAMTTRGVPRGAADLAVWPGALDDLQKLSVTGSQETSVAAIRALGEVLLGRAVRVESHCRRGASWTVVDVDGLHCVVLTTRTVPRPAGRRSGGRYETVELIAVDQLAW